MYLQGKKHEMDPQSRVLGLEREQGFAVETVLALALAREMNLGVLLRPALFDGALDRQRQAGHQSFHVGFDLVEMFVAEVLDGVVHRVGLEDADALRHAQSVGHVLRPHRHSVRVTCR